MEKDGSRLIEWSPTRLDTEGRGAGVWRIPETGEERMLHVPGLLPGEDARVLVVSKSQHRPDAFGVLQARLSDSPLRVTPLCPSHGVCGGCLLQHFAYKAQLDWKQVWVRDALREQGIYHPVDKCVGAPDQGLGGRRVAKFVVAAGDAGELKWGAYAPNSHQVVDTTQCPVLDPVIRHALGLLQTALVGTAITAYDENTRQGDLRYVVLRATLTGHVQLVWVVTSWRVRAELCRVSEKLMARWPALVSVVGWQNDRPGNAIQSIHGDTETWLGTPYIEDQMGSLRLRYASASFMQANGRIAEVIYAQAATWLALRPKDRLLDMYCGVGGMGLTALQTQPSAFLTGVEENQVAVFDAEANAVLGGWDSKSASFYASSDWRLGVLESPWLFLQSPRIRKLVLNPPRKGCAEEALQAIVRLRPDIIVYVSCSPETLARDLVVLNRHGYVIERVAPYDLHPHTPHVETLVLLRALNR